MRGKRLAIIFAILVAGSAIYWAGWFHRAKKREAIETRIRQALATVKAAERGSGKQLRDAYYAVAYLRNNHSDQLTEEDLKELESATGTLNARERELQARERAFNKLFAEAQRLMLMDPQKAQPFLERAAAVGREDPENGYPNLLPVAIKNQRLAHEQSIGRALWAMHQAEVQGLRFVTGADTSMTRTALFQELESDDALKLFNVIFTWKLRKKGKDTLIRQALHDDPQHRNIRFSAETTVREGVINKESVTLRFGYTENNQPLVSATKTYPPSEEDKGNGGGEITVIVRAVQFSDVRSSK